MLLNLLYNIYYVKSNVDMFVNNFYFRLFGDSLLFINVILSEMT